MLPRDECNGRTYELSGAGACTRALHVLHHLPRGPEGLGDPFLALGDTDLAVGFSEQALERGRLLLGGRRIASEFRSGDWSRVGRGGAAATGV